MRFKNRLPDKPLRFVIDKMYDVEPGGFVEISDRYAFAVQAMGVQMDEVPPVVPPVVPPAVPAVEQPVPAVKKPSK